MSSLLPCSFIAADVFGFAFDKLVQRILFSIHSALIWYRPKNLNVFAAVYPIQFSTCLFLIQFSQNSSITIDSYNTLFLSPCECLVLVCSFARSLALLHTFHGSHVKLTQFSIAPIHEKILPHLKHRFNLSINKWFSFICCAPHFNSRCWMIFEMQKKKMKFPFEKFTNGNAM